MQQLQRSACIVLSGGLRSTPTSAMEMIFHLPSLIFYFNDLAAKSGRRHCVTGGSGICIIEAEVSAIQALEETLRIPTAASRAFSSGVLKS